jgi:hypothetical protein
VAHVDQHSSPNHCSHRGAGEIAESFGRLGEEEVEHRIGEERDRIGVRGDLAPEQVSDGDVSDPALGELADCTIDRLGAQPEMESSLEAVDERHPARGQRIVELARVMRQRGLFGVVLCYLLLHVLEVAKHAMYVGVAWRMVVALVGVHLVERRVEDRERHADSPARIRGTVDRGPEWNDW